MEKNKDILKKELTSKWEEFRKKSFPQGLEDLDIHADLAELDGFIAGLVSSYLGEASIDKNLIKLNKELDKELSSFSPKNENDKLYYLEYLDYKNKIDELTILLAKCLDLEL